MYFFLGAIFYLVGFILFALSALNLKDARRVASTPQYEIHIDRYENNKFALTGARWEWLRDVPSNFVCPLCRKYEPLTMRLYLNSNGLVYGLFAHHCRCREEDICSIETQPYAAVGI